MSTYFQNDAPSDIGGMFVSASDLEEFSPMPGIVIRSVGTHDLLTAWSTMDPGVEAPTHSHPEHQMGFILEGETEFILGAERRVLRAGDVYVVPPHVPHGAVAGPDGVTFLDVFTPAREGLLPMATIYEHTDGE